MEPTPFDTSTASCSCNGVTRANGHGGAVTNETGAEIAINILALRESLENVREYQFVEREIYARLPLPATSRSIRVLDLDPPNQS
jgi:hypothetical protein